MYAFCARYINTAARINEWSIHQWCENAKCFKWMYPISLFDSFAVSCWLDAKQWCLLFLFVLWFILFSLSWWNEKPYQILSKVNCALNTNALLLFLLQYHIKTIPFSMPLAWWFGCFVVQWYLVLLYVFQFNFPFEIHSWSKIQWYDYYMRKRLKH